MNHKLLWAVVVFTTVFGTPSIGRSQAIEKTASTSPTVASSDVVKVGEYQSKTENLANNASAIAEIHSHNLAGRQAATLYLRKIPVLTFVGKQPVSTSGIKVGAIGDTSAKLGSRQYLSTNGLNQTKIASMGLNADIKNQPVAAADDPVQRATVVAARINQLVLDKVDPNKIGVSWESAKEMPALENQPTQNGRYLIKIDGKELVEINGDTRLADTTNNPAKDALQATNRIRRLIGNAPPLNEIANLPVQSPLQIPKISLPKLPTQIASRVRGTLQGIASWYGYDGSGNRTATGERYNPEGLTAAHRSLPFGTRVRVTNTRNGRSVVVRINDRGPFIRGRIIDLSAGAARILGVMRTGVAPVRIEVLGR
ncbi:septal ring lytic transglycosylase RlpA family protein [Scytonema sp. UIC 10036]|uniref:septal ring lytic transglycosylase RlpA family protein n=1 Tax=Scytonema sp. UIC 10036 TaxID=2304196 RepID=UPI0012DAD5BF|nr:septal ring lytic transglycosylase RlpA family protein [Scytonema sp. UIC 10036]MUG96620.1 septal ring lytic transglycosylase RlpA family protein [Scytonema sp. UIC 10036]